MVALQLGGMTATLHFGMMARFIMAGLRDLYERVTMKSMLGGGLALSSTSDSFRFLRSGLNFQVFSLWRLSPESSGEEGQGDVAGAGLQALPLHGHLQYCPLSRSSDQTALECC